jgi:hypothetical protein
VLLVCGVAAIGLVLLIILIQLTFRAARITGIRHQFRRLS